MIKFLNKYKAYSLGVYAFLLFIQFVLKDYFFPISILFYAIPLILIIGFGCFILWLYQKNKFIFILLLTMQSCLVYYWLNNQYYIETVKTNSAESKSVLFWNIAKNKAGFPLDIVLDKTTSENIDILTFVETDSVLTKDFLNLKTTLKHYTFKKLKGNMLIGVKGNITSVTYKTQDKSYTLNHIISEINNKETSILIIDVYASCRLP